jgi:hypothetical protein
MFFNKNRIISLVLVLALSIAVFPTLVSAKESHNFVYGEWESYDDTQHRRNVTCSDCDYSAYEYENHNLEYGEWKAYTNHQHYRLATCFCGYETKEYGKHDEIVTDFYPISDEQHRRDYTCVLCPSKSSEIYEHEYTFEYPIVTEELHTYKGICVCTHEVEGAVPHIFETGEWEHYDETQHKRTDFCDCGYSINEYGNHIDEDKNDFCDECYELLSRFCVTVPSNLKLNISQDGRVFSSTTAKIINNSTAKVKVNKITLNAMNGWKLVSYDTDMSEVKVDSKLIGFSINGIKSTDYQNFITPEWIIAKGGSLTLNYNAVISPYSAPVNEQVLDVAFLISWA